jgi:hypothetical protein
MSVLIKDIQRNSKEIIRIEVSEFKGRELINIRIWFQAIDGSGQVVYKPTQKGVALNISEFMELKDGILKLEQYLTDNNKNIVPEQPQILEDDETMSDEAQKEDEEESDEKKEDE